MENRNTILNFNFAKYVLENNHNIQIDLQKQTIIKYRKY